MSGGFQRPAPPIFGGGCVVGPNEYPLRPGEVAVLVNMCMVCSKSIPHDAFPDIVSILDANGDVQHGVLCKKHAGTPVVGRRPFFST